MKRFFDNFDKIFLGFMAGAVAVIILIQICWGSNTLGWVSSALQVVTVAIALSAWVSARKMLNTHKKIIDNAKSDPEAVILSIGVGTNLEGSVAGFVKEKKILQNVEEKSYLPELKVASHEGFTVEVFKDRRLINVYSDNMPVDEDKCHYFRMEFCDIMKQLSQYLHNNSVTSVHLFYGGPVALAYYIADSFNKNHFSVVVYHYKKMNDEKTGIYVAL